MSLILKNSVEISKSQINKSPSKQTFSFSRKNRFDPKEFNSYCQQLYDLPTTNTNRAAGIGYGQRSKENEYRLTLPGPSHYNLNQHSISQESGKNKGWTMGVSRERMEMFSILPHQKYPSPGPGTFLPQTSLSKIGFSMRGRPKDRSEDIISQEPGPGAYDKLPSLNANGKYFYSNFKSVKGTVISPLSNSKLLKENQLDKNPGPGAYDYLQQTGISPVGQYFVSNLKGSASRTFNKAIIKRNQVNESYSVGPGSYELPSEFGVYDKPSGLQGPSDKTPRQPFYTKQK